MKILGLVGTMGTGKDTIAEMLHNGHGWEVAALADELKRVSGLIFDIPTNVMFGPSKMRATLDERVYKSEYWADCEERAITHKVRILNLFPPPNREHAWITLFREIAHFAANREKCTARYILQRMGTEWGRTVYRDVWIDALGRVISNLRSGLFLYTRETGLTPLSGAGANVLTAMSPVGIAITDVRFENEIKAVQQWGGKCLWVDASQRVLPTGDTHASEPTYDSMKHVVNGRIDNNGTPFALAMGVDALLDDKEFWDGAR